MNLFLVLDCVAACFGLWPRCLPVLGALIVRQNIDRREERLHLQPITSSTSADNRRAPAFLSARAEMLLAELVQSRVVRESV